MPWRWGIYKEKSYKVHGKCILQKKKKNTCMHPENVCTKINISFYSALHVLVEGLSPVTSIGAFGDTRPSLIFCGPDCRSSLAVSNPRVFKEEPQWLRAPSPALRACPVFGCASGAGPPLPSWYWEQLVVILSGRETCTGHMWTCWGFVNWKGSNLGYFNQKQKQKLNFLFGETNLALLIASLI